MKRVNHADLKPVGDSKYRVKCPECNVGILTMRRDYLTLRLLDWDMCPNCGTKFKFEDIESLE